MPSIDSITDAITCARLHISESVKDRTERENINAMLKQAKDDAEQLARENEQLRAEVAALRERDGLIMQAYWNFVNADSEHVIGALGKLQDTIRGENTQV